MAARALVTGATGFTGSHLGRRLLEQGAEVRALVRSREMAKDLEALGADLVVGDVRDRESTEAAVRGVDEVYHIAALYREDPVAQRAYWDVNAGGTRNMLEAARRAGVQRFVHCSTVGVHGNIEAPPADENAPYDPHDLYQESKREGERIALEYAQTTDLPVTVFRPSAIYGPGDTRFLKLFRTIQRRRFAMIGSGKTLYHFVYIDDLVDGILLCASRPEAIGSIYILAGSRSITVEELCELVADAVGGSIPRWRIPATPVYAAAAASEFICRGLRIQPPFYRRRLDFFLKDRAFDIGKARRELGYQPKVELDEGIRRTAEWYVGQGFLNGR